MLGRRGLVADYIAAVRGTLAMRRERGQARLGLALGAVAITVAFVGLYTVGVKGQDGSADADSAARGQPANGDLGDPDSIMIGDGDGFVVSDGQDGGGQSGDGGSTGPGAVGDGTNPSGAPGTTGPNGVTAVPPGTGVLPSDAGPGGSPPLGSVPGNEGGGGTETSLPTTSTTGSSSSSSTPDQPGTSPTTEPAANPGLVQAVLALLGLGG